MKVLIVHAHENPDSFCSALALTAYEEFTNQGHTVTVSDLYKMEFDPVGSMNDFKSLSDREYYKYPIEQFHASQNGLYKNELVLEMRKLLYADLLIFNFPLWWFSVPAILKGWIDRVMAYGVAYGSGTEDRFKGKRAFVSVTTGSTFSEDDKPIDEILANINDGVLGYVGFDVLPAFVGYGVSRISQKERKVILEKFRFFLSELT